MEGGRGSVRSADTELDSIVELKKINVSCLGRAKILYKFDDVKLSGHDI